MMTHDARVIRRAAGECLKRVTLNRKIRLLGVRVSTLEKMSMSLHDPGLSLFD